MKITAILIWELINMVSSIIFLVCIFCSFLYIGHVPYGEENCGGRNSAEFISRSAHKICCSLPPQSLSCVPTSAQAVRGEEECAPKKIRNLV